MRPLIALAPPHGAIGQLLEETHGGKAISQKDVDSIADYIATLYNVWQEGDNLASLMNIEVIRKYERRESTKKLAEAFDRLLP
jgi:hypothetical protein